MQIPINFTHRIVVENLDTGERKVYLAREAENGKSMVIQIPDEMSQELGGLLPEMAPPLPAEQAPAQPGPVDEPELPAPTPSGLTPGELGGKVGPKDAFGAAEG